MTGAWERLQAQPLPTRPLRLPLDQRAWDEAEAALQRAEADLAVAARRGAEPRELVVARDAAQAVLESLPVNEWEIRALAPVDYAALVAEYPAKDGATHGWNFDPDTFLLPLLAETVSLDGERRDVETWQKLFASGKGLTEGQKNTLINTALELNTTATLVPDHVGKGSGQTPS